MAGRSDGSPPKRGDLSMVSKKAGAWRCDMMPIEVCIYCSRKIDEKEKSVNLSTGVAHLACAKRQRPGRSRSSYDTLEAEGSVQEDIADEYADQKVR